MMKFPLSFSETTGGYTALLEGHDDYYRQLLAIAARTEPGVHPLTPDFGIMDPTFKSIDRGQFLLQAGRYVPEIQIISIETELDIENGTNIVNFSFKQRG